MYYDPATGQVCHGDGSPVDLTDPSAAQAAHAAYVDHFISQSRRRVNRLRLLLATFMAFVLAASAVLFSAQAKSLEAVQLWIP